MYWHAWKKWVKKELIYSWEILPYGGNFSLRNKKRNRWELQGFFPQSWREIYHLKENFLYIFPRNKLGRPNCWKFGCYISKSHAYILSPSFNVAFVQICSHPPYPVQFQCISCIQLHSAQSDKFDDSCEYNVKIQKCW